MIWRQPAEGDRLAPNRVRHGAPDQLMK